MLKRTKVQKFWYTVVYPSYVILVVTVAVVSNKR